MGLDGVNRNLRLKLALQAQSSSAILRNVLKEVLASTIYAASVTEIHVGVYYDYAVKNFDGMNATFDSVNYCL